MQYFATKVSKGRAAKLPKFHISLLGHGFQNSKKTIREPKYYGAPIVSLFYMLNICSIEYSFYISNISSVFQMLVPYFKYLFYISNIYSQFEIFVQYPKNLCYISNICSMLKWLYSLPSLFCTIPCFKYSSCISNTRSICKIFISINIHFILIKVAR